MPRLSEGFERTSLLEWGQVEGEVVDAIDGDRGTAGTPLDVGEVGGAGDGVGELGGAHVAAGLGAPTAALAVEGDSTHSRVPSQMVQIFELT